MSFLSQSLFTFHLFTKFSPFLTSFSLLLYIIQKLCKRDILKKLNTATLVQNELAHVSKKVDSAQNNIKINGIIEEFISSVLQSEFTSLWFFNTQKMTLLRERDDDTIRELSLDTKEGILYKCFMMEKGQIYNYIASDKDYVALMDNPDNIKIKSKIILPLLDQGKLVGIVTAYSSIKKIKKFVKDDMELLEALSPYLVNILYKMHMPTKSFTKESMVIKNIKEIEKSREVVETSDETLHVVANFVHDIRTPANTLYGFLELIEDQITDKRLKEYLINAKESAGFINELTSAMLDRVSLHRERAESKLKEIESTKFFAGITEMFISNMHAKQIGFNIYIDPRLPKLIEIEELKLKRTLINLLGNACKFTPNGKNIEFFLKYDAETKKISISIKDEGIGIPKEKQKEIFKAFKQADDTTALNYGGTGLGLSICAEYVRDMGGELQVKSEVDKGTVFYFNIALSSVQDKDGCCLTLQKDNNVKIAILMSTKNSFSLTNMARYMIRMGVKKKNIIVITSVGEIPSDVNNLIIFQHKINEATEVLTNKSLKVLIVEEELFSIASDENNRYDVISQYGYYAQKLYQLIDVKEIPKALIVDDDKTSVILLERILENEYCEVDTANNGKIALEMIIDSHKKQTPYNVVYIDNNMPLMSGIEVMKNVREYERDNNLKPIYVASTSGNVLDMQKDGKDFDLYIGKPFKVDDIRKALNH